MSAPVNQLRQEPAPPDAALLGPDGSPEPKARRLSSLLAPLSAAVLLLVLWQLTFNSGVVNNLILPAPGDVAASFYSITFRSGLVWEHAWVTTTEAVLAFVIGSAGAAVIAISAALSPLIRRMIYPFMIAFQVTPRIAIAPAVIAALGFGIMPKVVIGAAICFFPIFLNMLTGLTSVEPDTREMFRSLGASQRKIFTHLSLPSAAPITFAGLQSGISFALIGAVVGEFISAGAGLGFLLHQFSFELNMPGAFAVFFWLTIIGLVLFGAIHLLSRVVVFWLRDEGLVARSERRAAKAARAGLA